MTALDTLRADMAATREALRPAEQLLALLEYVERALHRHGRSFEITRPDAATLRLDIALFDIEQHAPPPAARALPSLPIAAAPQEADLPPVAPPAPEKSATPGKRGRSAPPPPGGYRRGRLDTDEMRIIHEMLDAGQTGGAIANRLGREKKLMSSTLVRIRKQRAEGYRATGAARVKEPPAPEPVSAPEMSPAERALEAHLDALGAADGWTPQDDAQLVDALLSGTPPTQIAEAMGRPFPACAARYAALNTRRGDLDHQSLLRRVLRRRAA